MGVSRGPSLLLLLRSLVLHLCSILAFRIICVYNILSQLYKSCIFIIICKLEVPVIASL